MLLVACSSTEVGQVRPVLPRLCTPTAAHRDDAATANARGYSAEYREHHGNNIKGRIEGNRERTDVNVPFDRRALSRALPKRICLDERMIHLSMDPFDS